MGISQKGPRLLNFAPILGLNEIPINDLLIDLMKICEQNEGAPVEIEFAMTFSKSGQHKFGFLQVRPMLVSTDVVDISENELFGENLLVSSSMVLGNGFKEDIRDVVYVKPKSFEILKTYQIATELEKINSQLVNENRPYLLMGFGRWGTSDVTAGIPINWGQISGAKSVIEASLSNINFEQSQGSHFFHNLTGFGVFYFSVPLEKFDDIDWKWLDSVPAETETNMVRHIKLNKPLIIKVDGRQGKGVIIKQANSE